MEALLRKPRSGTGLLRRVYAVNGPRCIFIRKNEFSMVVYVFSRQKQDFTFSDIES